MAFPTLSLGIIRATPLKRTISCNNPCCLAACSWWRAHALTISSGQQKYAKCGIVSPGRCLAMDATDARAHVALGKLLVQQRRWEEARAIYEEGSTATGGQPVVMTGHQHT